MRLQCCKHNYQALMIGLVLFLSVGIASATVGVSGTVYGETAQGKYLYAPYIQVKFCTNSNGGGYCGSTTADSLGNYSVTLSAAGNYWMFAWDDKHYWGSSTQSTFCCAVQIGSWWSYVYAVSFPRPSLPQAFYPQNNQMNVPWNTGFLLSWSPESDSQRKSSVWPITYDLWASSWNNPVVPWMYDLPWNGLIVGKDWLVPLTWYNTKPVAKMKVNGLVIGAPGDPYYRTPAAVARWATGQ